MSDSSPPLDENGNPVYLTVSEEHGQKFKFGIPHRAYGVEDDHLKPWILEVKQKEGKQLTARQQLKLQHYKENRLKYQAKTWARRERKAKEYSPIISRLRVRGLTDVEIAVEIGVPKTTFLAWETSFPEIFDAALEEYTQSIRRVSKLKQARGMARARTILADEAPNSAQKIVTLRDTAKSEKIQFEASKFTLQSVGIGREKSDSADGEFAETQKRFIRAVVERVLPGSTQQQDVLEAEVVSDASQVEGADGLHGHDSVGSDQEKGSTQGQSEGVSAGGEG